MEAKRVFLYEDWNGLAEYIGITLKFDLYSLLTNNEIKEWSIDVDLPLALAVF